MVKPLVIMPVKDSLQIAEEAIRAIVNSTHHFVVYDDNSTTENAKKLDELAQKLNFKVIHISEVTSHPSPNYRWVLIDAQKEALSRKTDLVIVESDVIIKPDTIEKMQSAVEKDVGMVAAITHDETGEVNFPYQYAKRYKHDAVCNKRFSFCCTLLTQTLLSAYSFENLDPQKNWYDVHISHISRQLGLNNILQSTNPVLHKPHSSRPWKQLKYTNPLLYYWRKLTQRKDRI